MPGTAARLNSPREQNQGCTLAAAFGPPSPGRGIQTPPVRPLRGLSQPLRSLEIASGGQLCACQPIQAHALLSGLRCERTMDFRRDAHLELAAVMLLGQRLRNVLA